MKKLYTAFFGVLFFTSFIPKSFGQNLLTESFDGSTFPPTGWSSSIPYDPGCCGYPDDGWSQETSGFGYIAYGSGPSTHSGYGMAYFDSYNISNGGTADLVTPNIDLSPYTVGFTTVSYWVYLSNWYSSDELDVYLNTSPGTSGATQLRAIYVDDFSYPDGVYGDGGWVQFVDTIPGAYTGSSNYLTFEAISEYGYTDIYLDDVSIDHTLYPPTVTNYSYCQYQKPVLPLSATGDSLRWYTTSSGGTGTFKAPIPNDSFPGATNYYVTQTINGTESPRALQTVTVFAKPGLPYAANKSYTYCQFSPDSSFSVIGQNLLWYATDSGGNGSPIAPVPSTSTPGTFNYYVSQTVNGCESDRLEITVTVNPKPGKPVVNSPIYYCQNSTPTPLTVLSGVNLLWYDSPTDPVGSNVAPSPVTSYPNDTMMYYVSQTVNGCESDRTELTVIIKPQPNVLIVGSAPYVCQYDTMSFTYFGSGLPSDSYQWGVPNGANIISGSGQGPLVVNFDTFGKLPVTLQVTSNGCSSPLDSYMVDIRKAPVQPFTAPKDACVGQLLTVQGGQTNETINQYNWDFDGAKVVYGNTGAGPYGISYDIPGTKFISLIATTDECPSSKLTDTINIHPLGDAHIATVSSLTPCQGDSVSFSVENYNPAYLYNWTPNQFFGTDNNNGMVTGIVTIPGTITLTVTTNFGCVTKDSVKINAQVCCNIEFPNAFSPNGDGKNDVFRPLQGQGHQQLRKFAVVDRWGQTMFETANENIGWDGKCKGVPQDIGTYYWYIEYTCGDGKSHTEKGEVILVR